MKPLMKIVFLSALMAAFEVAFAIPQNTADISGDGFVDLTATDLQKKKNMLDCELRLEGGPPNYKLVYSTGESTVPESAIVKRYGNSHALINVRAHVGALNAKQLFVRLHNGARYELSISCRKGAVQCVAPVAYTVILAASEKESLIGLQAIFPRSLLSSGKYDASSEANVGAILLFDRANLFSPAMDGHSGAQDSSSTNLHYVCGTSTEYWQ